MPLHPPLVRPDMDGNCQCRSSFYHGTVCTSCGGNAPDPLALEEETTPQSAPAPSAEDLRRQLAEAIAVARGLNPACQRQGSADDGAIDGHWPQTYCPGREIPWHYGWRDQLKIADACLATLEAANAALVRELEQTKAKLERYKK